MMLLNIIMTILLITETQQSVMQKKLIYQRDMSEYCKRRVLPSIFLAKNSVDTSAIVMHFSQIELPYSCPISVRAESGNNIIMMIKVSPLEGMYKRCAANKPELLVYEMGETFGGYWGPMGQNIFKQKSVEPKIYTLKTTTKKPTTTLPRERLEKVVTDKPTQKISEDTEDEDFISMDMPLVNISGKFVVVDKDDETDQDEDAMFDLEYNVTPEPGVLYDTTVLPIVQFSIKNHPGWRKEGDDGEPRFDLDIVEKYTPDHRLTSPHYKSTRRLKFKKISPRTTSKRRQYFLKNTIKGKLQTLRYSSHKYTSYDFPTTKLSNILQNISRFNSWKTIEELINKANLTDSLQQEGNQKLSVKKDEILHKISDMKHNFSIYLQPNLSLYDSLKSSASTTVRINTVSTSKFNKTHTKAKVLNNVTSKLVELNKTTTSVSLSPLGTLDSVPSGIYENYYLKGRNATSSTGEVSKGTDNKTKSLRRKKREIHSIEIFNAVPHKMTTTTLNLQSTISRFRMADMQELAQLVELYDDELYGRLALRFLRQYLGPVVYNICDFNMTSKQHHVHLFNASRVVIALNNFTNFADVNLVLTSARALIAGEMECPDNNIECQVAGTRVCIDAMSACDGVPNCGSNDIYDEDRLMCGASEGLQHNVYIAAFTFLAVLLTFLYSIHYWLRRCVPKVAEAFFIYTNGTENILNLKPKMRSPHDFGDSESKLFFHPSMLDVDIDIMKEEIEPNCCKRFMRKLCCGLTLRKRVIENPPSNNEGEEKTFNFKTQTKYSFTQFQLQNLMDLSKSMQSGHSAEVLSVSNRTYDVRETPPTIPLLKSNDSILTLEEPLPEDYKDELEMLKYLKKNRKSSSKSLSQEVLLGNEEGYSIISLKNSEEMEIKNVEYHKQRLADVAKPEPSGVKPKNKKEQLSKSGPSGIRTTKQSVDKIASRRLRFDEKTTMIPASIEEVDENEGEIEEHSGPRKHSTFLDTVMGKQKFFGGFDDDNESPQPKEHKRFWGSSKAKK